MLIPEDIFYNSKEIDVSSNKINVFDHSGKLIYRKIVNKKGCSEEIFFYYVNGAVYKKIYLVDNQTRKLVQYFNVDGNKITYKGKDFENINIDGNIKYKKIFHNFTDTIELEDDGTTLKHTVYNTISSYVEFYKLSKGQFLSFNYSEYELTMALKDIETCSIIEKTVRKYNTLPEEYVKIIKSKNENPEFNISTNCNFNEVKYVEVEIFEDIFMESIQATNTNFINVLSDSHPNRVAVLKSDSKKVRTEMSKKLGLKPDSCIVKAFIEGNKNFAAAKRDALVIKVRHEMTRYDDLLSLGYTKEEARQAVNDELNTLIRLQNNC